MKTVFTVLTAVIMPGGLIVLGVTCIAFMIARRRTRAATPVAVAQAA